MSDRRCDWCHGPIPSTARRDSICCSKRCRQARHRFRSTIGGGVAPGQPRRLAYADPPYPGLSKRYYGDHPDYAGEVDHAALIASLSAEYDAWALSTNASSLQAVLALCPPGARVAAWVRGERPNDKAQLALNAWEPVIYFGDTRRVTPEQRDASRQPRGHVTGIPTRHVAFAGQDDASDPPGEDVSGDLRDVSAAQHDASRVDARRIDALVYGSRPRLTDPGRVTGAKPAAFCRWMFDLLGATPADTFHDVFPGSGGVARAWAVFCEQGADRSA